MIPEVGRERQGAEEVEGELLAYGGGGGGDDLLDDGASDGRDVAAGGGLLEGGEESSGLAESVVGAEISLDGLDKEVHLFRRRSVGLGEEIGDGGQHLVGSDLIWIREESGVESDSGPGTKGKRSSGSTQHPSFSLPPSLSPIPIHRLRRQPLPDLLHPDRSSTLRFVQMCILRRSGQFQQNFDKLQLIAEFDIH